MTYFIQLRCRISCDLTLTLPELGFILALPARDVSEYLFG